MPVLREGNVIHLPVMSLEVVEACSGIRSLVSLTALAVIYGYFVEARTLWRIALVIAAIPIAVVANGLRIMGTGLVVQYWDPQKGEGFFHTFSGWIIFVLSLSMLFALHGDVQVPASLVGKSEGGHLMSSWLRFLPVLGSPRMRRSFSPRAKSS